MNIRAQQIQNQGLTEPKLTTVDVGPFRLPGVTVNRSLVADTEFEEMINWARENGAYVTDSGLLSWRDPAKRDWFILRWS